MQNIRATWARLDPARQAVAILGAAVLLVTLVALVRLVSAPSMSLLYAGLDPQQASEVVANLDQQGVVYEVRGSSIFVDGSMRDQLRMTLAGMGLPANSAVGYELLDNLSGFGTTSQMFDAAYWRAKEGELARTLLSSPHVRHARVHIANPEPGPFRREQPPTASVTLTSNGSLPENAAEAFRFLVASAVPGLTPENVSIIDATTGRVVGREAGTIAATSADRSETLRSNVERLLAARVGPENVVVEVTVETSSERESIRERRIDPETRVAISTDVEEIATTEENAGGAGVTVASNLPDGDATGASGTSQRQNSETRSLTNFDLSETTREIERQPGAIKRLTVAVLLNAAIFTEVPNSNDFEDELADIRELVETAVGFNESRGDTIAVKILPFEAKADAGTEARTSFFTPVAFDPVRLAQFGALLVVALALGLFVIRPILTGRGIRTPPTGTAQPTSLANPTNPPKENEPDPSSGDESDLTEDYSVDEALPPLSIDGGFPEFDLPSSQMLEDPVEGLKGLIEERQADTIEILRSWLEDNRLETIP